MGHEEIKGAFLTFQKDADQIYPGWKEKLGYTGESSVQAATFDWAKKSAAAAFVGARGSCSSREVSAMHAAGATGFMYSYQEAFTQIWPLATTLVIFLMAPLTTWLEMRRIILRQSNLTHTRQAHPCL